MEKLEGQQCLALYLPQDKDYRVMGVAGSGKTLIAMYRFIFLYLENPDKNIELLTYNKPVNEDIKKKIVNICDYLSKVETGNKVELLRSLMKKIISSMTSKNRRVFEKEYRSIMLDDSLQSNVNAEVETVYTFCHNEINLNYKILSGKPYKKEHYERLINSYKQHAELPDRSVQFFVDEIQWLIEMNIVNVQDYIDMDRIGRRGTRLIKGEPRKQIFGLFMQYLNDINDGKHEYSMDNIYNFLFNAVDIKEQNKVDFLIVDEFQDLCLNMMQALRKCVRDNGNVLFLGDSEQNIFGSRIAWKDTGFVGSNILHLDHVYRSTDEICEFAKKILDDPRYLRDEEDEFLSPFQIGIKGEKPQLVNCSSKDEMITLIRTWLKKYKGKTAIICCNNEYLSELRYYVHSQSGDIDVVSIKRVKGMEYDNVIIPYYDRFDVDIKTNGEKTKDEVIGEHLRKLYVAVTRARRNLLLVTTKGNTEYERV